MAALLDRAVLFVSPSIIYNIISSIIDENFILAAVTVLGRGGESERGRTGLQVTMLVYAAMALRCDSTHDTWESLTKSSINLVPSCCTACGAAWLSHPAAPTCAGGDHSAPVDAVVSVGLEEGESAVTEHVFHVAIEILQGGEFVPSSG